MHRSLYSVMTHADTDGEWVKRSHATPHGARRTERPVPPTIVPPSGRCWASMHVVAEGIISDAPYSNGHARDGLEAPLRGDHRGLSGRTRDRRGYVAVSNWYATALPS
jgi:hypothetical protein